MCRQLVRLETMMKIHTTQNLSSPAVSQPTNISLPREIRYTKYSDGMSLSESDKLKNSVSFKGNKKEILDKAIKVTKRKFAERVANKKIWDKVFKSGSFSRLLEITNKQEVLINSATALIICTLLRPAAIMALPGDRNKKDCAYASAHSFSSGVWGFFVPLVFIRPLAKGYNHVISEAGKYLRESTIKKRWPHVNLESIKNADGTIKPMSQWKDYMGNDFIRDIKDVKKVAKPKHISEVSEKTLKKFFPNLDVARNKNVSPNQWVKTDGNKASIDLQNVFIAVKDTEKNDVKYYPLKYVTEDILKEVYPDLDVASTKAANGERLHFNDWRKKDGTAFEFNMNNIFLSDWSESRIGIPFITGKTYKDSAGKIKDICYQKNNKDGAMFTPGTEITPEMVAAAEINAVVDKFGGWLPDLVVSYPRATATIAIIPFVLKEVFGIEKTKKVESKNTEGKVRA